MLFVMKETPVPSNDIQEEIPVLDPSVFLLRRTNRGFVERRHQQPHLKDVGSIDYWMVGIIGLVGGGAILCAFWWAVPLGYIAIVGVLWLMAFGVYGQLHQTFNTNPILNGRILPGTVTHSEKIRIGEKDIQREFVGIRYQFFTTEGDSLEGYAEGDRAMTSQTIIPARGTPVYVWYDDEGNHYLL